MNDPSLIRTSVSQPPQRSRAAPSAYESLGRTGEKFQRHIDFNSVLKPLYTSSIPASPLFSSIHTRNIVVVFITIIILILLLFLLIFSVPNISQLRILDRRGHQPQDRWLVHARVAHLKDQHRIVYWCLVLRLSVKVLWFHNSWRQSTYTLTIRP